MKLTVATESLAAAMTAAARIAAKISPVPIATSVLLAARPGQLTLTATDYDAWLEQTIAADVDEPGSACLPAHTLYGFTGTLATPAVKLTVEDGRAALRSGRSSVVIGALPAQDFPVLSAHETESQVRATIKSDDLRLMFKRVAPAMNDDATKPFLDAVHICVKQGRLRAEAAHRAMVMRQSIAVPDGLPDGLATIIPRATVKTLIGLLPHVNGDAQMVFDRGWFGLSWETASLRTKIYADTFPDLDPNIPTQAETTALCDTAALLQACRRLALLMDKGVSGRNLDLILGRDVTGAEAVRVRTVRATHGQGDEEIDAALTGPDTATRIKVDHLLMMLDQLGPNLILEFNAAKPDRFILRDAGDPGWLGLLMVNM